ncbi:MAG: hypothetical protein HOH98_06700 [Flavobacteriaceae bacterium]|nr:hypothetical protein [Flavobacteriaceae bacterium]MBT6448818.1 hypothetical protein [Flavobacteriaceae bacterium]
MKKIYCEKLNSNDDSYTVELINVDSEFAVSDNDLIFEFETSKANIEIHAEFSGFLYHNLNIGSEVKPGELLYIISEKKIDPFDYSLFSSNLSEKAVDDFSAYDEITFSKGAKELIKKEKLNINKILEKHVDEDFISKDIVESYIKNSPIKDEKNINSFKVSKIAFIGGGKGFTQCLDLVLKSNELIPTTIYDDAIPKNSNVHAINVRGGIDYEQIYKDFQEGIFDYFIVTISTDLEFRAKTFNKLTNLNIPSFNLIHPSVNLGFNLDIGQGNVIFSAVNIGPEVSIGNNNFISSFSNIEHHCTINSNCTFGPGVMFSGSVTVQNNVKFGTGVFCEPFVKIGSNSVISSGSIITTDVKKNSVLISKFDQTYKPVKPKND